MPVRTRIWRVFKRTVGVCFALVLLAAVFIQIQNWVLRRRAERLLADVHRIRLHQSDWSEAQALMKRWGAWGHYNGTCTSTDCVYSIILQDTSRKVSHIASEGTLRWLDRLGVFRFYNLFGGRTFGMQVRFLVQDERIWRTSTSVELGVPPGQLCESSDLEDEAYPMGDYGYPIMIYTRSRETLRMAGEDAFAMGTDEQLAWHTNFKAGQPSACTNCLATYITYTPETPAREITSITSFDFSCLTRYRPCISIQELLPAAAEFDLYDWAKSQRAQSWLERLNATMKPEKPAVHTAKFPPQMYRRSCDIPVWVVGRDARYAVVVDVQSTQLDEYDRWRSKVKIVSNLKGRLPWTSGTSIAAYPYEGEESFFPERLMPGKRYVLLPYREVDTKENAVYTDRCGALEYTPEVVREVERGIAKNDHLRGPELDFGGFPWEP